MRLIACFLLFFSSIVWSEGPVVSLKGCDEAGFFCMFQAVLGMLDAYDKEEISGVEINFGKSGYYYDESMGENWWNYYFEPFRMHIDGSSYRISFQEKAYDYYLRGSSKLSKGRCNFLINKYMRIQPKILQEVKEFLRRNIKDSNFIGVHYRGTDKMKGESTFLSVKSAVLRIKQKLSCMKKPSGYRIFVATDDQSFLDHMKTEFGKRICYFEMERSTNNLPIHMYGASSGYIKGKMALLDCLVLSKSVFLFRTSSNLSNVSLVFNPSLESVLLNAALWKEGDRE